MPRLPLAFCDSVGGAGGSPEPASRSPRELLVKIAIYLSPHTPNLEFCYHSLQKLQN